MAIVAAVLGVPNLATAQSSPFLTGATALQTNIIGWLTPIAVILIMVLGGMAMANRIVENCGNTLILRCSASEGGGTSRFASRLVGEREVLRTTVSRSRRPTEWLASTTRSEHFSTESAFLPSEIEQLPDLTGLLKVASRPEWMRVALTHRTQQVPPPEVSTTPADAKRSWMRWRADQRDLYHSDSKQETCGHDTRTAAAFGRDDSGRA
jgi:type IV secretory pathway TraG/TraD family ATPase VirD4